MAVLCEPPLRVGDPRSCACEGVHIAGWKSLSGGTFTRLQTEGYCVVATRGGELPEVNNPSVTT